MTATKLKQPTRRMRDLAISVVRLTNRHKVCPSLSELADDLGVNIPRAFSLAHQARDRGLVTFIDGRPRTIRVVDRSKLGRSGSSRA